MSLLVNGAMFEGITVEEMDPVERFSPLTGLTVFHRWKGDPNNIDALLNQLRALGYEGATSWEKPYKILEASFPEDASVSQSQPLADEWEVIRNLEYRDIWLLPKVKEEMSKWRDDTGTGGLSNLQKRAYFRADLEAIIDGERFFTDEEGEDQPLFINDLITVAEVDGLDRNVLLGLFEDLSNGVTKYPIVNRVLRHTLVTNRSSTVQATLVNELKIFQSTGLLIAREGITSEKVKQELPEGIWLKMPPQTRQERSRFHIEQDFWYARDHSTFIYEAAA